MTDTLIPQQARSPLAYVMVGGKRLPAFIELPWYKYLVRDVSTFIGDSVTQAELDALQSQVDALADDIADLQALEPSYKLTSSVDFGSGWSDKAQSVITGQTWVTASSAIQAQVKTPAGTDPDEMYLLDMRAEISDVVVGVGFTVTVYSEPEATGVYSVMVMGQ